MESMIEVLIVPVWYWLCEMCCLER